MVKPIAGDTVGVTAEAKYMSCQLFEDKDSTRFVRFDTQSAPQPKPEEPQEDYSKIILDISNQDDAIVNHLHKFAGVILAGHVGQSFAMRIRLTLN